MSALANNLQVLNSLDTSDNQFHNLGTIVTTPNGSGQFLGSVICRRNSDGVSQGWQLIGQYKNVNGTVTTNFSKAIILGTSGDKTALNLADINFVADGSNIQVQVKGLSATAMQWACNINGAEVFNLT